MFKMRVKDNKFLGVFGGASSVYVTSDAWRSNAVPVVSTPGGDGFKATNSVFQASGSIEPTTPATILRQDAQSSYAAADFTTTAMLPSAATATTPAPTPARKVLSVEEPSIPVQSSALTGSSTVGGVEAVQSVNVGSSLDAPAPTVSSVMRLASAGTAEAALDATVTEPEAPVFTTAAAPATAPAAALAATPNKIADENKKKGNPRSEWAIEGDGDGSIQGFATEISTNIGQTVDFKIATDSTHYRIDIYRMGYYGGDGARKVASIDKSLTTAQIQPHPIVDMSLGLIDCGNWSVSASWEIPGDAVSGVYFAKLVREDGTEGASIIPFVVRDDASTSDIVFQTSDTTWQAYNAWGGASLYYGEVPVDPADMIGYLPPNCSCGLTAIGRASAVSYNRPIITNTSPIGGTHDFIFGAEQPAIEWLEQNGYDVSYISGVDATRSGNLLLNHQAYLSVGHDEYWSAEQRSNVEAARDSGVNLAFWSGNEVYWKVRWETSIDGNGTPYRTMVCYKETWGTSSDPSAIGTGTWRDPRYADPGQQPENALTGTMFTVDSYRADSISIPYDYSNLRFWRNTDVANLQPGESYNLVKNLLGYEWDSDVENGFRPAGLINLSLSTIAVDSYLFDYGTTVGSNTATHSLTMYRAESGALVFGAGTVFWSWGLSSNHEGAETPTDPNVQQAMVNMFADMGIQPTTLVASLALAAQSTDTLKPTSSITSPTVGGSFLEGQHVTITGTAQDFGGGIIAGVEISTDGGQRWYKATGKETWSYNWVVQASGTYTIMSRAVDDSVNMETPSTGKQVTVNLPTTASLWTLAATPATETAIDRDGVELGVRFQSTTGGSVQGIRFYKGFYNIGEHVVSLWKADGTLLATGISTGESLSGWQTVMFSSPIAITAGTTYVASYHSNGFYSVTDNYFGATYSNGPLKAVDGGGAYIYSANAGTFPGNSPAGANYWVDVVFDAGVNNAPVATDDSGYTVARNGTFTISVAALVANDTDANGDALTITAVGNALHGSVTLNAQTGAVIFTPDASYAGPANFSYTLSDGRGGTAQGNVSLSVEEGPSGVSLFQPDDGPANAGFNENAPLELGMKFVSSASGAVTGIRFYKAAGDTGAHTGSIWTSDGSLLGTVAFSSESLNGWQTATFTSPIQLTAGVTYVASYHTTGSYVATANYFTTAHANGPLTALSAASSGGNGVFSYGSNTTFPTSNYQAANYWVDVVFNQSTVNAVPVAANDNGFVAYSNTALSIAASALLANDTDADGDVLSITGASGATHGTVTFDSQTNTVIFTPTNGYTGVANFSYSVSDGRGGTSSASVSLTVGSQASGAGLFSSSDAPSVPSGSDSSSVELGVKFLASAGGAITGLRYYKSALDTGAHVGSLWSSTGQLLTSATFSNETASGWQTVTFSQPITITAGATYVASYHSNGFYAATPNYFTSDHSSGALTAPSGANGVYAYGAGSLFPSASYNSTNYWVDVLYQGGSQNTAPVAANDPGYSTAIGTPISIQASALLANDSDPDGDTISITGVSGGVNGTATFDSQSNTITFTPTAGYSGAASFSYTIADAAGATASAQVSVAVNNQGGEQNVFAAGSTPTIVSVNDNSPVNLGMKFEADTAGWITGIRFYKGDTNTGSHTGYLWTSTGTLLASATFSNETTSGWQSVNLSTQVEIDADTTYVVSYSTNGNYSATAGYFDAETSNGNLQALSSALSGGNGVYAYGSSGLFPTSTYNNTNYYVDVAFKPQLAA
ncbi:Mo-co oxidoreductase dimerization domain protein [Rhizobium sp. Root1203]|nr:Mo-co oxidoreductase dimerization domain protein [Rhizobium sp. Root1203]